MKTCPFKISLFGSTVLSVQVAKFLVYKMETVAFGSSVVQFISMFKPKKPCNTMAGGLRNFSAPAPTVNKHLFGE